MVTRDRIELKKDAFPGILSYGKIAALAEAFRLDALEALRSYGDHKNRFYARDAVSQNAVA